jgi:phosphatidylinositol alpha-mannosyltransferase
MSIPLPVRKRAVTDLLARHQFDVLHVQMPYSPMLAARILRAAPYDVALVGTFHILPYSWVERGATHGLGLVMRRNIKLLDAVVGVSEPAARFASKAFGVHADVLPNPVDLDQFRLAKPLPRLRDGRLNIVYLGRLVPRKGCMELLRAVNELKRRKLHGGLRVVVCGTGPQELSIKKYINDNRLTGLVQLEGFVSEADKPSYLASADIAVFPSTGGESFGIVLIEAMAAGAKVVLAGDNPGYRTVMAGREQQLFDPTDTGRFADLLHHYILNEAVRHKQTLWQRQHVRRFDVGRVGTGLLEVYAKALRKRGFVR